MLYRSPRILFYLLIILSCTVFVVSAQEETPTPTPLPVRTETYTAKIPFGENAVFHFRAGAGDTLIITARSVEGNFDPHMTVHGEDGVIVASNDDHDLPDAELRPEDARIDHFMVPETGDYMIQVGALNAVGGDVQIQLQWMVDAGFRLRREAVIADELREPISSETSTQTINPYDKYVYAFDAQRGDVFTFIARGTSGDIDPRLALYLLDSLLITANEDHGTSDPTLGRGDALLRNVIIPDTGRYWLEVRGYEGTTGTVALTIEQVARQVMVYPGFDQAYDGSLRPGLTENYIFDARVGDYVTITMRSGSSLLDPVILLSGPDGQALIDNDNHGFNDADLDFYDSRIKNYLIMSSGTYNVEVGSMNNGEGDFSLTINIKRDRRLLDDSYDLAEPTATPEGQ